MSYQKKLPLMENNFSDWYNEVVYEAELVDNAPIRGCMVLRPYGYKIWELIQVELNKEFIKMKVDNCAFPLLIPMSYIESEKDHVEGFAPELAVVSHVGGKELEEKLVVRPTSETIIHSMFSKWIKSWRDLPLRVNQWCSVVRWEKRPRPFIRSTEFWWQEGHTAHETREEAYAQAHEAGSVYEEFIKNYLAIDVLRGEKPSMEKFPGAEHTITFEAMMGDGKALQMGTSHILNQSFCRQFNIKFQNKEGVFDFPWLTSWGVTTRLIGAMVMVHGDSKGLVIPPLMAPIQFIIVPILSKKLSQEEILLINNTIESILDFFKQNNFRAFVDTTENSPGFKYSYWELKGVPFRIEIGKKEIELKEFLLYQRDNGTKKKVTLVDFFNVSFLLHMIDDFQKRLLSKSRLKLQTHIKKIDLLSSIINNDDSNFFYETHWCNKESTYEEIKKKQLTVRCIIETLKTPFPICFTCEGKCKDAVYKIIVAKAY